MISLKKLFFDDLPKILQDFLIYMNTIKGKSENTTKEYFYDLRTFFRFLKIQNNLIPEDTSFDEIKIADVTLEMLQKVTLNDLYEYMYYVNQIRGNSAASRSRKVSSLKSFYKYLNVKLNVISYNPAEYLDAPKIGKTLPRHIDLDSSKKLLESAVNDKRDYCMLTLLLNCGLRVSELVGINISDITANTLTILGKGNKERNIYLNKACINAIKEYLEVRPKDGVKDQKALFLNKNKERIGVRGVQLLVKKYLSAAGLDTTKYSTHKLRHTAATLMYKYGNVDIRALQEILGHENLSTTEIYTHIDSEQVKNALNSNPLADENPHNQ